jgi:hypothetical protein
VITWDLASLTVIAVAPTARTFEARSWSVDDRGYLAIIDSDETVIARYAPGWQAVYYTPLPEAASA